MAPPDFYLREVLILRNGFLLRRFRLEAEMGWARLDKQVRTWRSKMA